MVDVLFGLRARNLGERVMTHGAACFVELHQIERSGYPQFPVAAGDVPYLGYAAPENRFVVDRFQPHLFPVEPHQADAGRQQQTRSAVVDDAQDVVRPTHAAFFCVPHRGFHMGALSRAQIDAVDAVEERCGPQLMPVGVVMKRLDDRVVR